MLIYLRKVILQDAVIVQAEMPEIPLFTHSIFQSPEFKKFSERLQSAIAVADDPLEVNMHRIVPAVGRAFSALTQTYVTTTAKINEEANFQREKLIDLEMTVGNLHTSCEENQSKTMSKLVQLERSVHNVKGIGMQNTTQITNIGRNVHSILEKVCCAEVSFYSPP